jgi:3',5'-cyclic AMP phosphodiesterase CpdA
MDQPSQRASIDHPQPLGKLLFTFAVVADTHVNQEEGKASSDFAVNRLSNARNRFVIHEINRAAPAFVLHLGDIVHPTPIHPGYATAAAAFHALAAELQCPLYLTPGNHDVGDKPGDWLPVPSVNDDFLSLYRQHFGEHYYSFNANACHFVIIDAQIINSGLRCEAEQRRWLEEGLAAHSSRRIFLCSHYPPYLFDADEESHYDNIDEPGRSWLLALCARYKVEALFAGHVHNFWYHLQGETEIYLLPSTAFVRLDYSEMFRVEPAPERGRNDAPKLGFFLVEVHERGHVAHATRTFGAELAQGATPDRPIERVAPVHTKSIVQSPIGIDLRYPWAERVEVAASGALDEFGRKAARNDYPLMSLWEMGIRRLRVPIGDLSNTETRERMRVLKRMGHEFTVYSHGLPSGSMSRVLKENIHLVETLEIIAGRREVDKLVKHVLELKATAPINVHLSKLQRQDDVQHHGEPARHVIQCGFSIGEIGQIHELLESGDARAAFDGFLFTVVRDASPSEDIARISTMMQEIGKRGCAYVRLAADNPAVAMEDDLANANRVAEAAIAAFAFPDVYVLLDTFADVDRGYFPRAGLVDRKYNPRIAGDVCRNLHGAMNSLLPPLSMAQVDSIVGARAVALTGGAEYWLAVMPDRPISVGSFPWPSGMQVPLSHGKCIDLVSSEIEPLNGTIRDIGGKASMHIDRSVICNAPMLLGFGLPEKYQ